MTDQGVEPGLRERKRLATRHAIQLAAIDLAAANGLDKVTIDEISRRADVSPRTFFNYFASKEAALVGDLPELPEQDEIDAFVHGDIGSDILDGLGRLVATSSERPPTEHGLNEKRLVLLKQYPQLFAIRMTGMREFEEQVREVVALRLVRDEPSLASEPDALHSRSQLITLVAFGAIRHAWSCWAAGDEGTALGTRLEGSFAELRRILTPAAAS